LRFPSADKAIDWALVRGGWKGHQAIFWFISYVRGGRGGDFSSDVEEMQGRLKEAGRKG